MPEEEINRRPEPSLGDATNTVIKAGLSAIPFFGGPAAELFASIFIPPIVRRRDEWIEEIAQRLLELERRFEDFKIETLSNNETFITTALQATQAALRNHQKDKLAALQNAIVNAALPNPPDEALQMIFLNNIDTSTEWHLRILSFLEDPIEKSGISSILSLPLVISADLVRAFPELGSNQDFCNYVVNDLQVRGLIYMYSSLPASVTSTEGDVTVGITNLGKQFLKFMSNPLT